MLKLAVEVGIQSCIASNANVCLSDLIGTYKSVPWDMQIFEQPTLIIEVLSPGNQDIARKHVRAFPSMLSIQELIIIRRARVGRGAKPGHGRLVTARPCIYRTRRNITYRDGRTC